MHRATRARHVAWCACAIALILIVLAGAARGQSTTPRTFEDRDVLQGLPHHIAFEVAQDRQGFLWIGTNDGLVRFDGATGHVFRHRADEAGSLSNNTVRRILEDRQGRLWIRTEAGLDRYDRDAGRFHRYPIVPWQIVEDGTGQLVVASARGVHRYNPDADRFDSFARLPPGLGWPDTDDRVWGARPAANGGFWFSTEHGVLFHVAPDGSATRTALPWQETIVLKEDARGRLWIGHRDGLTLFDPRSGRPLSHPPFAGIPGPVVSLYDDLDGTTWIGGAALHDVAADGSSVRPVPLGSDPLAAPIRSLVVDREGLVWLATPRGVRFHNPYRKRWGPAGGGSTVMAIEPVADDRWWLGTLGAGLARLTNGGDVTPNRGRAAAAAPSCLQSIWALLPAAREEVWVGSDVGLCRQSRTGVEAVPLTRADPHAHQPAVFALRRDRTGTVWAGTTAGLYAVDPTRARARRIPGVGDEHDGRVNIEGLLVAADGTVWAGTSRSDLHRIDLHSHETRYFPLGDAAGLRGSEGFWTLAEVGDGRLWLGSDRGLFVFDPSSGVVEAVGENRGMPAGPIYAILHDERGSLWLSTNDGLVRHDNPLTATRSTALVRHYTASDGLPFVEFNRRAGAAGSNGWLAFGGMGGVVRFRPAEFRDNPHPPLVHVLDVERARFDGPSIHTTPRDGQIALSTRDASFTIHFTAPTFADPHRAAFSYRLEPVDPDWVPAAAERRARYAGLAPGTYTFRVRAANADGVWNREGAALTVLVPTPWWATSWFRLGLTGAVAVLFGLILRRVATRRLRRRVQALELDHRVRDERERISRDLHDHVGAQLTTLLAAIELTGLRAAQGNLADVRASLADLREDAEQTMAQVRETAWSLRHDHVTAADLLSQIQDYVWNQQRAIARPRLSVHAEGDLSVTLGPGQGLHLFRIAQEAAANAVRHAGARRVRVTLTSPPGDSLRLTVHDDGTFRPVPAGHAGAGLANMRSRAREIGARFDLRTDAGGTAIDITLPLPARLRGLRSPGSIADAGPVQPEDGV